MMKRVLLSAVLVSLVVVTAFVGEFVYSCRQYTRAMTNCKGLTVGMTESAMLGVMGKPRAVGEEDFLGQEVIRYRFSGFDLASEQVDVFVRRESRAVIGIRCGDENLRR